ncbi:AAA family ATPase [Paeniglutamicibacter antarcticus]|uniref:AAA family ATPase n=1 Tax=Arthrobacter terrae TaxID=2935737 RepID=A0A931CMD3_9MICC|nr:AAA family ATPase [Arthrobacter terrae]MBG0738546.1 AAA family ATPase [Arthrobacter terrae]
MSETQWKEFMRYAARFAGAVDLDGEERNYKLVLAERLKSARQLFLDHNPDWFERLRKDLSSTNLVNQYFMMKFVDLGRSRPDDLWRVLEGLWGGDADAVRLDAFVEQLRPFNPAQFSVGGIVGLGSLLLMSENPCSFPPYRARAVKKFLKLVGWDDRGANGTPSRRYELLLEAMDELLRLAPFHGIELRDRLGAQGLMWQVLNAEPPEDWPMNDQIEFRVWRGETPSTAAESNPASRPFGPNPELEAAARAILDAGLLSLSSPLGGGETTWTSENAAEILHRVLDNYDGGEGSFLSKLEKQLHGASPAVIRLTGELIALQSLPLVNITPSTKKARVERVLSWLDEDQEIPEVIASGLAARGAFNGGTGFNMNQWRHLRWLAKFVAHTRESEEAAHQALRTPEAFIDLTASTPDDVPAIRYTVEYLAWPSYCEPVVNKEHRRRIRNAFAQEVGGANGDSEQEIARDLNSIRTAQEAGLGHDVEWYDEPFFSQWSGARPSGVRAWLVRQNQGGIAMLDSWLDGEFISTRAQHLGSPAPGSGYDEVQAAVNGGYQHIDYSERKARAQEYFRFLSQMKPDDFIVTAHGEDLYLGVVTGSAEYVEVESSRLRRDVLWRKQPIRNLDLPAPLPRLLEEQGTVVDLTDALPTIRGWFAQELEDADLPIVVVPPLPQPAVVPILRPASDELASRLHLNREDIQEVIDLLQTRSQIVFYGPPGTGKTYLAGKIARFLAGEEHGDHVKTVQFHPSYAYEDFFEGYRPAETEGGAVGFSLEPGPLRQIAGEASAEGNRDKPYFLIIDEMNRGNLAKVFGELYFLLEYRDQSISLQYNPTKTFVLPPNLFIIGTMNTSDRSIAMVDAAIRRRFAFVELHPEDGMISGLLERYLAANHKPMLRAQLLNALNAEIEATNRDLMIGPSYFMKDHAETDRGLEQIWKYELLPLLEEQYFGRLSRQKVHEKFGLGAMRKTVERQLAAVDLIAAGSADVEFGDGLNATKMNPTDAEDASF